MITPGPWAARERANGTIQICGPAHHAVVATINPFFNPEPNAKAIAALPKMIEALIDISKGAGSFNRDPLIHAENTIEEAKATALEALKEAGIEP